MKSYIYTAGTSILAALFTLGVPTFALAQSANLGYLSNMVGDTQSILNMLLPLVVTLALLFFFWGIMVFILNAGDPEGRSKGIHIMIWGIVALFVIVSIWGIVGLLGSIFGIQLGGSAPVPGVVTG